ncbi:MAG: VCBS repeat-containing protein [Planctomycetota bacterium]
MRSCRSTAPALLPLALLAVSACADHGRGNLGNLTPLRSVGFDSRILVATGTTSTVSAAVVDADLDGRRDLVAIGLDDALHVELGQGGTSFAEGQVLPLGGRPIAIAHADLDHDGDTDLCVLRADGTALVLLGDGVGGFTATTPFALGSDPLDMTLGDIDGDGEPDIVVTEQARADVCVFRGVGDGTFLGRISLHPASRGEYVGYPRVGDFDGDGRPDLAMADFDLGRVDVLLGDASGLPAVDASVDVGASAFGLAAGDLFGDARDDLVVSVYGESAVKVIATTAPGVLSVIQSLPVQGRPAGLCIADLDGDQRLDVAVSIVDRHAIAIFRNTGAVLDPAAVELPVGGSLLTPFTADLDSDGIADLVVPAFGADSVNLFRGTGTGLRGGRFLPVTGPANPALVETGDLDGDGRSEVMVASFTGSQVAVAVARTATDGRVVLDPLGSFDVLRAVQNLQAADLDGDGRLDLVVPVAGGVKLLRNRSDRNGFALEMVPAGDAVLAPGSGPFEVAVGDVDADRRKDIVVAYHVEGRVSLLRASKVAFEYLPALDTPLSGRPLGVALGDFDGDGITEVAVSRLTQATVTILEVTPTGLLPAMDIPVGPGPNYLRAADFNRDGRNDLVVSDGASDTITVLMALGGNAFDVQQITTGSAPTALLTTDLNDDGFDDVFVASLRGSDCRVILGDGRGGFAPAIVFPGIHQAITAALADLDGDGLRDLLLGSFESRAIATFINASRRN